MVGTAGVCILSQLMRRSTSWLVSGQQHRRQCRRRVKDNTLLGQLTTGCTGDAIARHRLKHPCDPADMQVPMPIEARAKPQDEDHSAEVLCRLVCLGSTGSMKQRRCLGIDSTHGRTDRWWNRCSIKCAVISALRRLAHELLRRLSRGATRTHTVCSASSGPKGRTALAKVKKPWIPLLGNSMRDCVKPGAGGAPLNHFYPRGALAFASTGPKSWAWRINLVLLSD